MDYRRPEQRTARIAQGQTVSDPVHIGHYMVVGLMPPAMTGTTLTFRGALARSGPFKAIKDSEGNDVSVAVADAAITLTGPEADAIAAWPWIQVVSNAAEGAERLILISLK